MTIDTWAPQNEQALHQILVGVEKWILKDGMAELRQSCHGRVAAMRGPPYKLLANHPIFAVSLHFNLRL